MPPTTNSAPSKRERFSLYAPLLGLWRGGPPVWPDSSGRPLVLVPGRRGRWKLRSGGVCGVRVYNKISSGITAGGMVPGPGVGLPGRYVDAEIMLGQHRYHEIGHERPRHALSLSSFPCGAVCPVLGFVHHACSPQVSTSPPKSPPGVVWIGILGGTGPRLWGEHTAGSLAIWAYLASID
jgi:hypothetical protein